MPGVAGLGDTREKPMTPAELILWFRRDSRFADTARGVGEFGYGFAHASTEEVATALGIDPKEAYRLLSAAKRKGLINERKERVKLRSRRGPNMGEKQVGWALWELDLTQEDWECRERKSGRMEPNADYRYLNLIEHRKRAFKEAMDVATARIAELDRMDLDRRAKRDAHARILDELAAAQDQVNARWPLTEDDLKRGGYEENAGSWGKPYGAGFQTPYGRVWMMRKGVRVRFFDEEGNQVGPEHSNVAPAVAYAMSKGWRDAPESEMRRNRTYPKYAVDYVLGRDKYTLVVEAEDRDDAYAVARDHLVQKRLFSASLQGTARVATQDDVDAAEGKR